MDRQPTMSKSAKWAIMSIIGMIITGLLIFSVSKTGSTKPKCSIDKDCEKYGMTCVKGECTPAKCTTASDCPLNYNCLSGYCTAITTKPTQLWAFNEGVNNDAYCEVSDDGKFTSYKKCMEENCATNPGDTTKPQCCSAGYTYNPTDMKCYQDSFYKNAVDFGCHGADRCSGKDGGCSQAWFAHCHGSEAKCHSDCNQKLPPNREKLIPTAPRKPYCQCLYGSNGKWANFSPKHTGSWNNGGRGGGSLQYFHCQMGTNSDSCVMPVSCTSNADCTKYGKICSNDPPRVCIDPESAKQQKKYVNPHVNKQNGRKTTI